MKIAFKEISIGQIKIGLIINTTDYLSSFDSIVEQLPSSYLTHIETFKDKNYALQSALCYLMLNTITGLKIEIQFDKNGKPYDKTNNVYFSFSHVNNAVVGAVSRDAVGVDLVETIQYDESICNLVCDSNEKKIELSENKNIEFSQIFSKKGSYIKLVGLTLNAIGQFFPSNVAFYTFSPQKNMYCSLCYYKSN